VSRSALTGNRSSPSSSSSFRPNVAADRQNIRRNADHLRGVLTRRGFTVEILETDGNPLVYGELSVPGASRTVLFYSHYDGQPVDPKAWQQKDPFIPVLRTGRVDRGGTEIANATSRAQFEGDWRLYARSASDDKAPIVALCSALDALKAVGQAPTSNIRVILDGEEEAGSPSLVPAIGKYRDKLRADLMVILDGPEHSSGKPTVVFGARGIARANLTVFGPKVGVHSGNYGNWIPNPAQRLASLLASMKRDDGRVLVAGFYDGIAPLTREERALLDAVPDDSAELLKAFGVAAPEPAFSRLQDACVPHAQCARPRQRACWRRRSNDHSGQRHRIDRHQARRGTSAADLIAKLRARTFAVRATTSSMARRTTRCGRSIEDCAEWLYPTAGPQRSARRRSDRRRTPSSRRSSGRSAGPSQLRTLGGTVPIAPFIEALGFSGCARADGQLRQQPARRERKPAARKPVRWNRDGRGDA
jgi:hypothetical protein